MGEACRKFDTPVTGGNVSFYNQNPDGPVYPTPTIGMVGLVEDLEKKMTLDFKEEGDHIYLLGAQKNDISCSAYLHQTRGIEFSPAPYFDLDEEYQLQQLLQDLIEEEKISSAHDISDGGLMITLFEKGFNRELGFDVRFTPATQAAGLRKDAFWFGEAQSRVVVTVREDQQQDFLKQLKGFEHAYLGTVTAGNVVVEGQDWGSILNWKELYDTAIENQLSGELESEGALGMI
jgi:phosphoribosylformylglycinamidine synthase